MLTLRSDAGNVISPTVLTRSHQRVVRVSVLDSSWNPLPEATLSGQDGFVIAGSVTQHASSDVRRSLAMSIANPDGVWTPDGPGSFFYWDRYIRVERGVRVAGVDYYAPLGVFLIDTPMIEGNVMAVTGADRMDRALRSEFTAPDTYSSGARVGSVIQDILVDAGIGAERWSVDDDGSTLGANRSFEVGESRLSAARAIATDFGLDVFADANGFMVVRPKVDPEGAPTVWEFAPGPEAVHLGVSKRWSRERFYNHVLVSGESANQDPIRAEAEDTNPASPTRVDGPMGRRLFKHVSAMITSLPQAQAVAQSLLWNHALIEETITLPHVPIPILEVDDAIKIVDAASKTDDRYLISRITIPLAGGPASLDVKKVRSLS